MQKYIGDNNIVLSLMGLRYIAKEDDFYVGMSKKITKYAIKFSYKGKDDVVRYETEQERDAMWEKLKAVLTNEKGEINAEHK